MYLTNALTGWEPPKGPKQQVMAWAELQEERDAAEHVKRRQEDTGGAGQSALQRLLPASARKRNKGWSSRTRRQSEQAHLAPAAGASRKFNLDDLYVRFFRLAERRIAEMSGKGVVSFISNFSYLSDPSFVVMRQRFLAEFDKLWFDCMNGDSRETGKLTPDGKPDPSVFSTEYNREGIRVGTAVCVIVRKSKRQKKPTVQFRNYWGTAKRESLLGSLSAKKFGTSHSRADPCPENRFSFRPESVAEHYAEWPRIAELCGIAPCNGLMEKRRGGADSNRSGCVGIARARLF